MLPVLFYIGTVPVRAFDVMAVAGMIAGTALVYRRARGVGLSGWRVILGCVVVILIGLVGTRLAIVLVRLEYYIRNWQEIFSLYGTAFQGGLIAGLLASFGLARYLRISYWELGDLLVPGVALGQAIGRMGCFLNGCCYGAETDSFLAMYLPTWMDVWAWRYPTQLMHAGADLLIMAVLLWMDRRKPLKGFTFLLYTVLYSTERLLIDFLRGTDKGIALVLPAGGWVGALEFLDLFHYDVGAGTVVLTSGQVGRWVSLATILIMGGILVGRWARARARARGAPAAEA